MNGTRDEAFRQWMQVWGWSMDLSTDDCRRAYDAVHEPECCPHCGMKLIGQNANPDECLHNPNRAKVPPAPEPERCPACGHRSPHDASSRENECRTCGAPCERNAVSPKVPAPAEGAEPCTLTDVEREHQMWDKIESLREQLADAQAGEEAAKKNAAFEREQFGKAQRELEEARAKLNRAANMCNEHPVLARAIRALASSTQPKD